MPSVKNDICKKIMVDSVYSCLNPCSTYTCQSKFPPKLKYFIWIYNDFKIYSLQKYLGTHTPRSMGLVFLIQRPSQHRQFVTVFVCSQETERDKLCLECCYLQKINISYSILYFLRKINFGLRPPLQTIVDMQPKLILAMRLCSFEASRPGRQVAFLDYPQI